jgi:SAM-dependent methyltransferase
MQLIRRSYDVVKNKTFGRANRAAAFRSAIKTFSSSDALTREEKTWVPQVSSQIHPSDAMYSISSDQEYLSAGLSAVRCIHSCLKLAALSCNVRTILDFACGYGRVLRFLKARFPDADITVSDIDPEALYFCKRAFAVIPEQSIRDFSRLSVSRNFDLIWCGSLLTHIDESAATLLLRCFLDHLAPDGLCVFTTHGDNVADSIQKKVHTYGLTEDAQEELLSRFYSRGYGYADYAGCHDFGISVVSRERMRAIARSVGKWEQSCSLEQAWDNLQDVYSFQLIS